MPKYDKKCSVCGDVREYVCRPFQDPPCVVCGGETSTTYLPGSYNFVSDEFVGGRVFENLGHEPMKLYSKSELKNVMAERGLIEKVEHKTVAGTDKSEHTQRFV